MALTGRADGPFLLAPPSAVDTMAEHASVLADLTGVEVDGPALFGERAALAGLSRQGTTSCGGATQLFATLDGWIAVSLAREEDIALLPAWLACDSPERIEEVLRHETSCAVVARGAELGLAVSVLAEQWDRPPVRRVRGGSSPSKKVSQATCLDLSSLWAGPLCSSLLLLAGMRVIKVESVLRPDGSRQGSRGFFDLIQAGKQSVALDFTNGADLRMLRRLMTSVDVVIESSRPRALAQLGMAPHDLDEEGPSVWISITGHGRCGPGTNRIAYGDDAAVAGGFVSWEGDKPRFIADAAPDPATGLMAAVEAVSALESSSRWVIDLSLSGVAAQLAGDSAGTRFDGVPDEPVVGAPPRARLSRGVAAELGADNEAVFSEFGL
jgi:hypothetical protein